MTPGPGYDQSSQSWPWNTYFQTHDPNGHDPCQGQPHGCHGHSPSPSTWLCGPCCLGGILDRPTQGIPKGKADPGGCWMNSSELPGPSHRHLPAHQASQEVALQPFSLGALAQSSVFRSQPSKVSQPELSQDSYPWQSVSVTHGLRWHCCKAPRGGTVQ